MSWELSNLLRVISTTIVIWIHASYSWWFATNGNLSLSSIDFQIFISTFVNQAGRFSIPLFVILSGFGLAKSEEKHIFKLKKFFQKRFVKILPAYVFFTVIHLATRPEFIVADLLDKFKQIWLALLDGSGDYHLYFLVIMLKCYFCYPILRLVKFSPRRLKILSLSFLMLITLCWITSLFKWLESSSPIFRIDTTIFWLPYLLIGIWIAKEPEWMQHLISKLRTTQWGTIWAVVAILEVSEYCLSAIQLGSATSAGHCYRPTVVILSLTFVTWAMSWNLWLNSHLKSPQMNNLKQTLDTFSGASFTTFLIHTDVLRLLTPWQSLGGIQYLLISAISAWFIGILLWKIFRYMQFISYKLIPTKS